MWQIESFGETAIRISTGDIYREVRDTIGEYAKYHSFVAPFIEHIDVQGGLLPDQTIIYIVEDVITHKLTEGKDTFIFTGFPRTIRQLTLVDDLVGSIEGSNCTHIHFDISDETSRKRAVIRRQKAQEQGLPMRPDDQEGVVEKRIKIFRQLTYPMLLKLDNEGRLLSINAEDTIAEIEKGISIHISKERL